MNRIVRLGLTPDFIRMRAASSVVAQPVPLSVVPVAPSQESMWPPTITYSSGNSVPGDVGDHVVERDRALLEVVADVELERRPACRP